MTTPIDRRLARLEASTGDAEMDAAFQAEVNAIAIETGFAPFLIAAVARAYGMGALRDPDEGKTV
jgi:hypothetical protein